MKHLRMLEELDLVSSFLEDSDQGGPSRRRYFPTTGFTMVVDIGPGLFNPEVATRPFEEQAPEKAEGDGRKLLDLRKELGNIDRELEGIKERRAELIAEKERILEEAGRAVDASFADYRSRKIVYEYIKHRRWTLGSWPAGSGSGTILSRRSSVRWRMRRMASDLERYMREIRQVGEDLEKAMRSAARDLDRLGREVLDDTVTNAKQGGREAEEALLRLEKDLQEGAPNLRREMDLLLKRMGEAAARVEKELKRLENRFI